MNTLEKRIHIRLNELGINQAECIARLDKLFKARGVRPVSQVAVSKVFRGETKQPKFGDLLAKALDCNYDWLMYGRGEKVSGIDSESIDDFHAQQTDTDSDYVTINQYKDVRGAMGKGAYLLDDEGEVIDLRVSKRWADTKLPANSGTKNLKVITGIGDSMKGLYNSGDPLIVDTGVKSIDADGVYFFRLDDEGYVKRLQKTKKGIIVISQNSDYRDWVIDWNDDIEVFGRVVKVWEGKDL